MLDVCSDSARSLSLSFNVNKSHCIVIGKMHSYVIQSIYLDSQCIEWSNSIKYLGVYLQSGKTVKFDINPCKRAFYAACNSIFMHGSDRNEVGHVMDFFSEADLLLNFYANFVVQWVCIWVLEPQTIRLRGSMVVE